MKAIAAGDGALVSSMLASTPSLATARADTDVYFSEIEHYVYAGDTALHVASAGYQHEIARRLVAVGAELRAKNRRGAEPLHYAADGVPGAASWNPDSQAATIAVLIGAGADANAADKNGVMPLHRAVRTRCSSAVRALLDAGADPSARNRKGSTPMDLALQNTGRGGSGSAASKAQQADIINLLERATP